MKLSDRQKLSVNRAISAVIGGLLVFAVMNVSVVRSANERIDELSSQLDTSRHEAGRLLSDARAQFENEDYESARVTLETLFENQPGSPEAEEGSALMVSVNEAEAAADAQWESAEAGIRQRWTNNLVERLRAELEANRVEMEENLERTVSDAWDDAKEDIREEWEADL